MDGVGWRKGHRSLCHDEGGETEASGKKAGGSTLDHTFAMYGVDGEDIRLPGYKRVKGWGEEHFVSRLCLTPTHMELNPKHKAGKLTKTETPGWLNHIAKAGAGIHQ